MGAGSGGGISGISTTTGTTLRGFTAGADFRGAALTALRTGFACRTFATRALADFALTGLPALRPDFRDACAFAMTAYATVGRARRQRPTVGAALEIPRPRPYAAACPRAHPPCSTSPSSP